MTVGKADLDVLERGDKCDKSSVVLALGFVDILNTSCLLNLVDAD